MAIKFSIQPTKDNFLGLDKEYSSFENSEIVIIPCPYEKTTSYGKGTNKGPTSILKASQYVEFFDEELQREICFEKGIVTLKPLNFINLDEKDVQRFIYDIVRLLLDENKFVILLGGEHSLSTAPIKAYHERFSESKDGFSVLHFDAHSDLRDSYEGTKFSHASFAARVAEFTTEITQIGIRAQCKEEYDFIKRKKINTFYAYDIKEKGFDKKFIEKVLDTLNKNVYITFDLDYFDPAIMPATGTPEPNGFFWDETMQLLKKVFQKKNVLGFDVVELSPRQDLNHCDYLAAKLVYKMISYKFSLKKF